MEKKVFEMDLGGRTLSATFSPLADQANGSVIMRYGETVVMVTAVMGSRDKEGMSYFPLMVDYEERFYAAGRILGGRFIKREGRPSDEAVLSGRIIDRTIRPLFDQSMRRDVHLVAMVLAIDDIHDPDILGVIGASLALGTSNIPWAGPVSAVKLGLEQTDGEFVINPTYAINDRVFNILVCGKDGNVTMIESDAKEINESVYEKALAKSVEEIERIQAWQKEIIAEIGQPKAEIKKDEFPAEAHALWDEVVGEKLFQVAFEGGSKHDLHALEADWMKAYKEKFPEANPELAAHHFETTLDDRVHKEALENNRRQDGRDFKEVRPLFTQAGDVSSIIHGSGIFFRGGTHVLSVLTLGGPDDSQIIEGMEVRTKKYFMHHYNFPPFSVGEAGRMGGFNRRAIGHGALAEKALEATLPTQDEFPYTIRLVSESTASNGSTSMGSVCASSLALMDGGVPIKRPTAGIAMGLMLDEANPSNYKILTDIQGPEDHYGDMDFKVAGTTEGITAIQMDIKVGGIPVPILIEAMQDAKAARHHILDKITEAIAAPREDLADSAPRVLMTRVQPEQIGTVIGSGGKTIHKIQDDSGEGVTVTIEEDGRVFVAGPKDGAKKALAMVEEVVHEYKVGEKFEAVVDKILDFGAVVKFGHFGEGLVHISEFAPFRLATMDGVVKEGEQVSVVVKEIDDKDRPRFSVKAADPEFAERKGLKPAPPGSIPSGGPSRGRPGGHDRGRGPRR